jgi:hypothetical protein
MHPAEQRAGRQRIAEQGAVDSGPLQEVVVPGARPLVEQQRGRGHAVIRGRFAAQHEVDEVFDQQPLAGLVEDGRLVLPHPQQPQRRIEGPDLVAAPRELFVGTDVLEPPGLLRRRPRAVPTDEGVEPVAGLVDRQAVHAHAGHGHTQNLAGDGGRHGANRPGDARPDLLGLPHGPLRVRRIGMAALGRRLRLRGQSAVGIEQHRLQIGRTDVDAQ